MDNIGTMNRDILEPSEMEEQLMKKQLTLISLTILVGLGLAACSKGSGTSATELIKKGDTALTNANYSGAKAYYCLLYTSDAADD